MLSFVSSPFNMIKTRLMLQTKDLPCGNRYNYSGLFDAVYKIFQAEGYIMNYIKDWKVYMQDLQ